MINFGDPSFFGLQSQAQLRQQPLSALEAQAARGLGLRGVAAGISMFGYLGQAQTILLGGDIAAQGALLQAEGYRISAQSVRDATAFNLEIDRINVQRKLGAMSRNFQRTLGRQIVQQAATGLAPSSKSFLQLRQETSNVMGRAILNFKLDAENTKRAKIFESQVKQVNLENQARAAEFRAASERFLASQRASQTMQQGLVSAFKGFAPTILGS